jgi:hypothetical protein
MLHLLMMHASAVSSQYIERIFTKGSVGWIVTVNSEIDVGVLVSRARSKVLFLKIIIAIKSKVKSSSSIEKS